MRASHLRNRTSLVVAILLVAGCKDLTGNPGLPAGTPNPSVYNSANGAIGLRNSALYNVDQAIPDYVVSTGLLSDELEDYQTGASVGVLLQGNNTVTDPLDERLLPDGLDPTSALAGTTTYANWQNVRGAANVAIGALATYDTAASDTVNQRVMRGELYAMEGYAEILLADLFCSGVPLSTLDFQHDFTYKPSSTTAQVYQDAIAKLDSAQMLAGGDDSLTNLARLLKGRAYLDLGQYAAAGDDVMTIPLAFRYTRIANFQTSQTGSSSNYINSVATVSNREGMNGLPYRSGGDVRTATVVTCPVAQYDYSRTSCPYDTLTVPAKDTLLISGTAYTAFAIADGIEAQLIKAEAQLQPADAPSGPWLTTLNTLRASAQLPDTSDPGTAAGRIALLFRERAYWLFMTGHRQGDMRRLLRQYGQYTPFQSQQLVYPTGAYLAPGTGRYGTDVNAPVPSTEYANPAFHGCIDRNP